MTGALQAGEDHRATTGEEAIRAYLIWRKRHLTEPDAEGRTVLRLARTQRKEPETSVAV